MDDDVIVGSDGKPRCRWAGTGDSALGRYHDGVWGTRTYDESALFEALTLGVFEAGLSPPLTHHAPLPISQSGNHGPLAEVAWNYRPQPQPRLQWDHGDRRDPMTALGVRSG